MVGNSIQIVIIQQKKRKPNWFSSRRWGVNPKLAVQPQQQDAVPSPQFIYHNSPHSWELWLGRRCESFLQLRQVTRCRFPYQHFYYSAVKVQLLGSVHPEGDGCTKQGHDVIAVPSHTRNKCLHGCISRFQRGFRQRQKASSVIYLLGFHVGCIGISDAPVWSKYGCQIFINVWYCFLRQYVIFFHLSIKRVESDFHDTAMHFLATHWATSMNVSCALFSKFPRRHWMVATFKVERIWLPKRLTAAKILGQTFPLRD